MTKKLRHLFPRLSGNAYQLKSPKTRRYNCLAWAAGHNDAWWDAALGGTWPEGVPDDGSVEAAVSLYERLGYTRAADAAYEEGVQKIAIYGDDLGYTHAARQLPDGRWTSKIGKLQDIEHDTLENLVGSRYGQVRQIMEKRPGDSPAATPPPAQEPQRIRRGTR